VTDAQRNQDETDNRSGKAEVKAGVEKMLFVFE
jgi:hypothetical protein